MRIWGISDTHGCHGQLNIPIDIDMVIFAGDMSNYREKYKNYEECDNFLSWLEILDIKHKLVCAGNHDIAISHKMINWDKYPSIIYVEHDSIDIEGINIFMSPYTPSFGQGWVFNKDRTKLDAYWQQIPENTDIVVTHGPPKGILDISENRNGEIEYCGDKALLNHIDRVEPQYHIFGHIHNYKHHLNQGIRTITDLPSTTFMNVSCVEDGRWDKGPISHGQIFEL